MPLGKLRSLGGKFGEEVQQQLGITTAGELAATARLRLDSLFGEKTASRIARLSVGLDDEEVCDHVSFRHFICCFHTAENSSLYLNSSTCSRWKWPMCCQQCVAGSPWWMLFQIQDRGTGSNSQRGLQSCGVLQFCSVLRVCAQASSEQLVKASEGGSMEARRKCEYGDCCSGRPFLMGPKRVFKLGSRTGFDHRLLLLLLLLLKGQVLTFVSIVGVRF